jgi:hypothetical protein
VRGRVLGGHGQAGVEAGDRAKTLSYDVVADARVAEATRGDKES